MLGQVVRQGTALAVPLGVQRRAALAAEGMAIPKRRKRVAGTYFVTSRTWQGRKLFVTEPTCRLFVEKMMHYREEGACRLHAFVLMPDHFHILLTPAADKALERIMQYIKGGSARQIRKELSYRFPVWQRGFSDHRIRDSEDFQSHVRYLEQNPVKKGLVGTANEYRWSSACGQYEIDSIPQGLKPL